MSMITVGVLCEGENIPEPLLLLSGALMYLNEGTLLNNLRRRYKKDLIYVSKAMPHSIAKPGGFPRRM